MSRGAGLGAQHHPNAFPRVFAGWEENGRRRASMLYSSAFRRAGLGPNFRAAAAAAGFKEEQARKKKKKKNYRFYLRKQFCVTFSVASTCKDCPFPRLAAPAGRAPPSPRGLHRSPLLSLRIQLRRRVSNRKGGGGRGNEAK